MNKPFFITTTLPYANSTPHVGHCLEFVQADALARHFRAKDIDNRLTDRQHNVYFNIGLDEHGLKIYQAAISKGVDAKTFVDSIAVQWYDFCKLFQISYDTFYRTSEPTHHQKVKKYWLDLYEKKDIYKKQYVGKYCVNCEEFKPEAQLVNGRCEIHQHSELQEISEENWFFRLSNYKDKLLIYVYENEKFLQPINKRNELINLIKEAEDISISRRRDLLPWGVQVPNDVTQTIYVWFEALLNYIFACGEYAWNNNATTVQLCGPDNLKFQALVWQGILLANGNKNSDKILVHGTILDSDGQKMSKSLGNVVDPICEVEKYGLDAVRYYILKGLNTYSNSNWSSKDLIELYNADLANNFGNLLARTLHLIDTHNIEIDVYKITRNFLSEVGVRKESILASWKDYEISFALEKTRYLVDFGNKYINDQKPWSNQDVADETLNNLYYLLYQVTELYAPVLVNSVQKIKNALKNKKKEIIFERIV